MEWSGLRQTYQHIQRLSREYNHKINTRAGQNMYIFDFQNSNNFIGFLTLQWSLDFYKNFSPV